MLPSPKASSLALRSPKLSTPPLIPSCFRSNCSTRRYNKVREGNYSEIKNSVGGKCSRDKISEVWCLRDKTISVNRSYAALDFCFRASRAIDASRLPTKAFLEQWRNPAAYSRFPGSQTRRRIILRIPLELYLRVICVLKHDALKTSSTL